MRGRKPKPPTLKLIQGNPGGRKLAGRGVYAPPMADDVAPPSHLTGAALAEWTRITAELRDAGLDSKLDVQALAALCIAVAQLAEAQEALALNGTTYVTETGYQRVSPWVNIQHKAIAVISRLSAEFGLTPSARTRVRVDDRNDDDAFEQYLRRGKGSPPA